MSNYQLSINNCQLPEGYKQTEVGVIPEDWDTEKIGVLASITTGSRNTQDRIDDGQYPFFVRSQIVERIDSHSFDGEAVLTAGDGVGTGKIFHYINGKFDFYQRVYRISHFSEDLDGYFFFQYFSRCFFERIMSMTAKSSVDSVRMEMIADMLLPLPPIKEQRAIATALSDVDALIAALDKLIAKKRHLKTATMQQLLTGKKRLPRRMDNGELIIDNDGNPVMFGPSMDNSQLSIDNSQLPKGYKQTEVGVIPEDWEVKQLEEITDVDPENLGSATHPEYAFKYISLEDVTYGVLNGYSEQIFASSPSRARRVLKQGDVLLSTVRPNLKSHLIFQEGGTDWVCSTGFAVLRCKEGLSESEFLFPHLFGGNIDEQIETLIAGSNYPAINSGDVKKLEIPVPPVAEQRAIATVLSDMDSEIAAIEARRAKTQAIKQGMMQQLLTGKVRLVASA
jgi:type I restriction enzyme S subunit